MEVEKVKVSELILDPSNVRKHDSKNLMAIKGSLAKFGQQKPLVVNKKNVVIAGNGTLEAAIALELEFIDIVRTELEDYEAIAYAIADNKTSDLSFFDEDALQKTLSSLADMDFDLSSIGFDFAEPPEFTPNLTDKNKNNDPKEDKLTIIVFCKSIEEHQNLFDELNGRGYKVKI